MTDYVKNTDYAVKDSLPSGNANKVVRGTELDTEFNDIASMSQSKLNVANPTFTGTMSGGTIDGGSY